jgi:NADH-quinone oxidoreductase subunit K
MGGKMIPLTHYLIVSAVVFCLSMAGIILNRKNVILLLVCIELMLLAVNTNLVAFSHYLNDSSGQIFVFFILTVAAAESAIGLALIVLMYRNRRGIQVDELNSLKG